MITIWLPFLLALIHGCKIESRRVLLGRRHVKIFCIITLWVYRSRLRAKLLCASVKSERGGFKILSFDEQSSKQCVPHTDIVRNKTIYYSIIFHTPCSYDDEPVDITAVARPNHLVKITCAFNEVFDRLVRMNHYNIIKIGYFNNILYVHGR